MLAFLLRALAPRDLLLLGYGRSWTEAEGGCERSDMRSVKCVCEKMWPEAGAGRSCAIPTYSSVKTDVRKRWPSANKAKQLHAHG